MLFFLIIKTNLSYFYILPSPSRRPAIRKRAFFQNTENLHKHLKFYAANSYIPRNYIEDAVRKRHNYTNKVKQLHEQYIKLYKMYVIPDNIF